MTRAGEETASPASCLEDAARCCRRIWRRLLALYLVAPFAAGVVQLGLADWARRGPAGTLVPGLRRLRRQRHARHGSSSRSAASRSATCWRGFPAGAMALLGFAVQLPLALPPLASGILLLFLLGYASPLGRRGPAAR